MVAVMIGINVICFSYVLFLIMGRIVQFDKSDVQSNIYRLVDNIMIVALVLIILFINRR